MQNTANSPGTNPAAGANRAAPARSAQVSIVPPAPRAATHSRIAQILRVSRWTMYGMVLILLILLLHKAAPPPVTTNPEAAARAEQKFADVQQAVAQGQSATLRINETELNSYLASHLELAGVSAPDSSGSATSSGSRPSADDLRKMRSNVRDVKVQLVEDRVKAYVVFDVHGKDMTLQLEGRLAANNGFLRFAPVSGQIGALPIPQGTLEAVVKRIMESPENSEKLKLPDEISDLRIENGEVVATYQEP